MGLGRVEPKQLGVCSVVIVVIVVGAMVAMSLTVLIPAIVPALAFVDDHSAESWAPRLATVVAAAVVVHGDHAIAMFLPPAVPTPVGPVDVLHHDDFSHRLPVDDRSRRADFHVARNRTALDYDASLDPRLGSNRRS
jgi:hypothetical protein